MHVLPIAASTTTAAADDAAREKAASLVGTVLSGRYRILDLLAMGGVGAVYLGEHLLLHKQVAIKVLHPDSQSLPDLVARFEREAVAGAHVQHPNVAAATDVGELEDGSWFLVLEYIRGTTLRDVIRRGPVPIGRAVRIARQIGLALAACHAKGILHRDVKPRNVMLIEGENDVVKLIDFGLAKLDLKLMPDSAQRRLSVTDDRITAIGAVFGTIAYLPPEAALGMDLVDERADLYALGIVLYEMLTGKHPFDTTNPVAAFRHHRQTIPPPFAVRAPQVSVPSVLEAVVMRLLCKAPDDRFPNADTFVAALDAATTEVTTPPSSSPLATGENSIIFAGPSILPPVSEFLSSNGTGSGLRDLPSTLSVVPAEVGVSTTSRPPATRSLRPWLIGLSAAVPFAALAGAATVWLGAMRGQGGGTGSPLDPTMIVATIAPATSGVMKGKEAAPETSAPQVPAAVSVASSAAPPEPIDAGTHLDAGPRPSMRPDTARAMLRSSVSLKDVAHAIPAFFALVEGDPASMGDPAVMSAARDLATAMAGAEHPDTDRVFDILSTGLGSDGLDILYEIVRARGGSKGADRAESILRRPEILARATSTMRVTFELRIASCEGKAALLDRAATEGDARTLMVLQTMGPSCLGKSEKLRETTRTLKTRLHVP